MKANFLLKWREKMAFELNSVPSWVRVHYTIYTRWAPNDRYKWSDITPISRLQKPQVTHLFSATLIRLIYILPKTSISPASPHFWVDDLLFSRLVGYIQKKNPGGYLHFTTRSGFFQGSPAVGHTTNLSSLSSKPFGPPRRSTRMTDPKCCSGNKVSARSSTRGDSRSTQTTCDRSVLSGMLGGSYLPMTLDRGSMNLGDRTVDGSEIRRSPDDMVNLKKSHYLRLVSYMSGGCFGFLPSGT